MRVGTKINGFTVKLELHPLLNDRGLKLSVSRMVSMVWAKRALAGKNGQRIANLATKKGVKRKRGKNINNINVNVNSPLRNMYVSRKAIASYCG